MDSGHDRTGWEQGWDGHETEQLARLARLPLTEKLRWLEQAHHLVLHLSNAAPVSAEHAADDLPGTKHSR